MWDVISDLAPDTVYEAIQEEKKGRRGYASSSAACSSYISPKLRLPVVACQAQTSRGNGEDGEEESRVDVVKCATSRRKRHLYFANMHTQTKHVHAPWACTTKHTWQHEQGLQAKSTRWRARPPGGSGDAHIIQGMRQDGDWKGRIHWAQWHCQEGVR